VTPSTGPRHGLDHRGQAVPPGLLVHQDGLAQASARLAIGGLPPRMGPLAEGYFVTPTAFTGVGNRWRVAREGVFGPVLIVIPWQGEDEAIGAANDPHCGLAAYVRCRDLGRALRAAHRIEAGWVQVNHGLGQLPGMSYGASSSPGSSASSRSRGCSRASPGGRRSSSALPAERRWERPTVGQRSRTALTPVGPTDRWHGGQGDGRTSGKRWPIDAPSRARMRLLPSLAEVLALPELAAGEPEVVADRAGLSSPVRRVHVSHPLGGPRGHHHS